MTVPVDVVDPRLAKAYAHPLRVQILALLDNRVASPSEIAAELGTPLSNTSYHVRQLAAMDLVELVSRRVRRGAVEHHYTAKIRPTIWDEVWAGLPIVVKRAMVGGVLQETIREITAAAEAGGFDREDFHLTRTTGRLDEEAWKTVSSDLGRMLKHFEAVVEQSEGRLARDPHADAEDGMIVLMHFPRASRAALRAASSLGGGDHTHSGALDLDENSPGSGVPKQ